MKNTFASARQSRRIGSVIRLTLMGTALLVGLALRTDGALRIVFIAALVLLLANCIGFFIPWGSREWVRVDNWQQPGRWLATVPTLEHEKYDVRGRDIKPAAELLGHVQFTPEGLVWMLNGQWDGVRRVVWNHEWQISARRSIGWIPQYQLALHNPRTGQTQTVWMLRSKGFVTR